MKATLQSKLNNEVLEFIATRKTLQLATLNQDGSPYASYAPFALGDDCFYVLLSDVAVHGKNLRLQPTASILLIEDEQSAGEIFARIRLNYSINADCLEHGSDHWQEGLAALTAKHGARIGQLAQMGDFNLFCLKPTGGRFVKGFAKAYSLAGATLAGEVVSHLSEGHTSRSTEKQPA